MNARVREWFEETHNARFELVRHFFFRLFDSEMFSVPGDWQKTVAGLFAMAVSFGMIFVQPYMMRYAAMRAAGVSAEVIHREIRSDELIFVAIAMVVTALLTALVWQSLFPSRRDCLALAGLPISPREIFLAKAGALLLLFGSFVVVFTLPWALLFSSILGDPRQAMATFAATAGVCVFVFFGLLACQGVLLTILRPGTFPRASLFVQALVFVSALGMAPLIERQPTEAVWWPPVWFVGLWEAMIGDSWGEGRTALWAMGLPIALSALTYLLSYQRYRRMLLEGRPVPAAERWSGASWLLERWIPDPREQAAFSFIFKTLIRSRNHRMILLAYCGIALGMISKSALDMPRPTLRNEGLYGLVVTLAPLAIALLITVGLRYLFSLPETLAAHWIFRITDGDGRMAWFRAVGRFVIWCGIAPVFLISLPASVAIFGWPRALALTLLVFFAARIGFEILFRDWQKLPFTCSYIASDAPLVLKLARYGFASLAIGPIGYLILSCSGRLTAFLTLFSFEVALWWRLRAQRQAFLNTAAVVYDGLAGTGPMTLGLKPPRGAEPESIRMAQPSEAPELFSRDVLVASRGIIPQEWRDELAAERNSRPLLLRSLWEDVRFAFRLIRRNPMFAAVVVLTLTIGIGINAAVFTVVNGLALRAHVADADSFLTLIPTARLQGTLRRASHEEYTAWRARTSKLRQLAAFSPIGVLLGRDEPLELDGLAVSCNFFAVEGVDRTLIGRLFVEEDCHAAGRTPVAVISEGLWRKRFSSDRSVIGRAIPVNNRQVFVIGVVPVGTSRWAGARGFELWMPYTAIQSIEPGHDSLEREDAFWLSLAGRLKPGVSRSEATSEFNVLARQTDRLHAGRHTAVISTDGSFAAYLRVSATGATFLLIAFFFGTFNLVLFLACANVATLMLSRAAARKREIAVRLSLGAPRIRLVRMLVTESLVLAAAAGLISAYLTLHVPKPLFHLLARRAADFAMPPDWRTFSYIAVVVLLTGVLAGLAPTLESLRTDLTTSLKGSSNVLFGSPGGTGVRGFLVSAQVALSMVLLVEAGLFVRSEDRALRADPGYAPQRVVLVWLRFPDNGTVVTAQARLRTIEQRILAIPGVRSVAYSDRPPLLRPETVELSPPERKDASQPVDVYSASPRFFETLGIPLIYGREFAETDGPSVVVSQSLAKAFWRNRNPIGRTIALPGGPAQVVGVAKDIEPMRIGGSDNPPLYRLRTVDARDNVMSVRFDQGAATGVRSIRGALREVAPDLVTFPMLFQSWIDRITADLWNIVALLAALGGVGILLATTGIYGAVSFSVNQRKRDLGIRAALGATRWDIIREVFVSGGRPVIRGLVAGLWMSMATASSLHDNFGNSIVRIDSSEPLLYGSAMLFLAIGAAAAMWGPARRGASADPLETLRCE